MAIDQVVIAMGKVITAWSTARHDARSPTASRCPRQPARRATGAASETCIPNARSRSRSIEDSPRASERLSARSGRRTAIPINTAETDVVTTTAVKTAVVSGSADRRYALSRPKRSMRPRGALGAGTPSAVEWTVEWAAPRLVSSWNVCVMPTILVSPPVADDGAGTPLSGGVRPPSDRRVATRRSGLDLLTNPDSAYRGTLCVERPSAHQEGHASRTHSCVDRSAHRRSAVGAHLPLLSRQQRDDRSPVPELVG